MALINCSECKKEISDTVDSCPHCGKVTSKFVTEQKNIAIKKEQGEKRKIGCLLSGVGVPFVIIFIIIIANVIGTNSGDASNSSISDNISSTVSLTQEQINEQNRIAEEEIKRIAQEKADRQNQINSLMSKMRIETDDVKDYKFIYDTLAPTYIDNNYLYLYISANKDNTSPTLRMKIWYTSKKWMFINSYSFKVDDILYTLTPNYGDVKRYNNTTVWEMYDFVPNINDILMIRDIVKSNRTILRYEGDSIYHDSDITQQEKNGMSKVLQLYDLMDLNR